MKCDSVRDSSLICGGMLRHVSIGLCLIASVSGCNKQKLDRNNNQQAGFRVQAFGGDTSAISRYTLYIPSPNTNQKKPLIVFLNGQGQNGDDGVSIENNFGPELWEFRRDFGCLAVAPQCSDGGSWNATGKDAKLAMAIIDIIVRQYNVDPDRIYLTGVSAGGSGVWHIGSAESQYFAALAPLCGYGVGDPQRLCSEHLPVWNFYNSGDNERIVEGNRQHSNELTTCGSNILTTEYHKSGHDCWNQAYRNKAMYEWLLQQSRSKNKLESEKFRLIDKEISLQNETLSSEGDELLAKSVNNAQPIACGEFPRLIDYHFHSKFVPGQTLALRLQSTNSDDQLVLHLPYAVDGPATFKKNSGNVFAYISPRAQNQLDPKGWNDIRLRVEKDRVSVLINGFNALDQQLDLSEIQGWNISLEPSGPEDTEMRFRSLRWRPLTWLMSSTN